MKLLSLQLKTQRPKEAIAFYTEILGLTLINTYHRQKQTVYVFQFPISEGYLELIANNTHTDYEAYNENRLDNYWKFSVFIDDIQQAYHFLKGHSILVHEPYQFKKIGYLMHTKDVENYQIEFIQRTFKEAEAIPPVTAAPPQTIGSFSLGLITIRTADPVKSIHFFETFLNLKLMVRMHVDHGPGFSLYFLGSKQLRPPSPDLDAIANREWLYQQTEPFIEIQHYWNDGPGQQSELRTNENKNMGLAAIRFSTDDLEATKRRYIANNMAFYEEKSPRSHGNTIQITSPDHQLISIEQG